MTPQKHKAIEDKMLKEFYDFVVKNKRPPSIKEFDDKYLFTYGYGSYRRRFCNLETIIQKTGTEKYILQPPVNMKRLPTSYSKNLHTWKIRFLLYKNPNAGIKELTEMFGTGNVTRSIRVTYYKLYKEIYGKKGSLRYEID